MIVLTPEKTRPFAATRDRQQMAKEIAANCTDPRLKHNLLTVVEMVPNMAVQLKILCAVKASSDDVDPDTINQLVTCAQVRWSLFVCLGGVRVPLPNAGTTPPPSPLFARVLNQPTNQLTTCRACLTRW